MDTDIKILVVDTDPRRRSWTINVFQRAEYSATGAASFKAARRLLRSRRYGLLITNLRLEAYNGLHLVFESHVLRPQMAAIIIDSLPDADNESQACRAGAAYLGTSPDAARLMALVKTLLEEQMFLTRQKWSAEPAALAGTQTTN